MTELDGNGKPIARFLRGCQDLPDATASGVRPVRALSEPWAQALSEPWAQALGGSTRGVRTRRGLPEETHVRCPHRLAPMGRICGCADGSNQRLGRRSGSTPGIDDRAILLLLDGLPQQFRDVVLGDRLVTRVGEAIQEHPLAEWASGGEGIALGFQ